VPSSAHAKPIPNIKTEWGAIKIVLKEAQIAFIGSGMMAEAMIKGLIGQRLLPPQNIIASGPRPERGAELAERYGIRVTEDNLEARDRDIVVLSVKPQFWAKFWKNSAAALLLNLMRWYSLSWPGPR
jgi:glutamyl-tRNA reductase